MNKIFFIIAIQMITVAVNFLLRKKFMQRASTVPGADRLVQLKRNRQVFKTDLKIEDFIPVFGQMTTISILGAFVGLYLFSNMRIGQKSVFSITEDLLKKMR